MILTEFDNDWPIPANFNRLITESLFAKQVARRVGAHLLLILVLPWTLSASTAASDRTTAATSATTSAVVILALLIRCLLLLLGHQVRAIFHNFETLVFFVENFLGRCRGSFLLRTYRHVLEGSRHEVADFANLLFFVVGLIQLSIEFI